MKWVFIATDSLYSIRLSLLKRKEKKPWPALATSCRRKCARPTAMVNWSILLPLTLSQPWRSGPNSVHQSCHIDVTVQSRFAVGDVHQNYWSGKNKNESKNKQKTNKKNKQTKNGGRATRDYTYYSLAQDERCLLVLDKITSSFTLRSSLSVEFPIREMTSCILTTLFLLLPFFLFFLFFGRRAYAQSARKGTTSRPVQSCMV